MEKFWDFVNKNLSLSPDKLRLKYHNKNTALAADTHGAYDITFDIDLAITQIECRRKCAKKFACTLGRDPQWLFPSLLAAEQATSDRLAAYHTTLVIPGEPSIDLTAGLGIDALHIASAAPSANVAAASPTASHVVAIELDERRAAALAYNCERTAAPIEVVHADCRDYLSSATARFGTAFIDPARRAADGSRIFAITDCQPDVIALLPQISSIAKRLIVKLSPMLDITHTSQALPGAEQIIAIGTPTECKELIAVITFGTPADAPLIKAVTLTADGESEVAFTQQQESEAVCAYAQRVREYRYIYEPYPAVMKAAPVKYLSQRYGVEKLEANTHLYVSADKVDDFPGDVIEIEKVITFESKHIKRLRRQYPDIRVTARNFDFSAEQLRSKLGVNDRGTRRLFAVKAFGGEKLMIVTKA